MQVKTDGRIFAWSLLVLVATAVPLMIWPQRGSRILDALYAQITDHFGVLYLWAGVAVLVFVVGLAASRFGNVKLGAADAAPRFSTYSWVAMLFCAGVATGILYWGTIEWAQYFETPPYGVEPRSDEAAEWASTYGIFHWG